MTFRPRIRLKILLALGIASLSTLGAFVYHRSHNRPSLGATSKPGLVLSSGPYGGFMVRLSHSGARSQRDELALMGAEAEFDVTGIVVSEFSAGETKPPLETYSVAQVAIGESGLVEPRRALEIISEDRTVWRLELAVFSGKHDLTPDLSSQIGSLVHLQVQSVTFGVTSFTAVRLDDADGLLLALDFRLSDDSNDANLQVQRGPDIAQRTDACGTYAISSLLFGADKRPLRPGDSGTVAMDDLNYRTWNLAASLLIKVGSCTDQVSDIAWAMQRLPDWT
jgi:hypothetical protein